MWNWTRVNAVMVAALFFFGISAVQALILPAKDSGNNYSSYSMGLYDGSLYLATGDSIHELDLANTAAGFHRVITGLRSKLAHQPTFDGGLAINSQGTGLLWMGYFGGVVELDLTGPTVTADVAGDFNGDANPDNVFSAAGGPGDSFYAMWSNGVVNTRVYRYDAATDTTTSLGEVAPQFSGGVAVGDDGTVYASTLLSNYPDPLADLSFWSYDPDAAAPAWSLLLAGQATGNGSLVVDERGDIYFNTTSGIGRIRQGGNVIENIYGDILDPNTFDPVNVGVRLEGLTYDAGSDTLYFAERGDGGGFFLQSLVIPEPATAVVIAAGGLVLLGRGRGRDKSRR